MKNEKNVISFSVSFPPSFYSNLFVFPPNLMIKQIDSHQGMCIKINDGYSYYFYILTTCSGFVTQRKTFLSQKRNFYLTDNAAAFFSAAWICFVFFFIWSRKIRLKNTAFLDRTRKKKMRHFRVKLVSVITNDCCLYVNCR